MREAKLMKKKFGVLLVDEKKWIAVYLVKGKSATLLTRVSGDGFETETFTKPSFAVTSKEVTV